MSEDPVEYLVKSGNKMPPEACEGSSELMVSESLSYYWNTRMDRVNLIRKGISYDAIEAVSKKMNTSVKEMLELLDIPQTTYNKRKEKTRCLTAVTVKLSFSSPS